MRVYDKNRREIKVNDVLKVYHFTGARRKRYYMYKIVKSMTDKFKHGQFLVISHLPTSAGSYNFKMDGEVHDNIEIVQGYGGEAISFEDRPKLHFTTEKGE